jgi:hypothetical protein
MVTGASRGETSGRTLPCIDRRGSWLKRYSIQHARCVRKNIGSDFYPKSMCQFFFFWKKIFGLLLLAVASSFGTSIYHHLRSMSYVATFFLLRTIQS